MQSFIRGAARAVVSPGLAPAFRPFRRWLAIAAFALPMAIAAGQAAMAHDFKAGDIEIDHPWSRAAPAGAKVAAGYAVIRNHGSEADRLVAVSGSIAARGEVHEMAVDDKGVMTMRPVDGVDVPAGGSAELKPGGFHIMFMDLTSAPREGESFKGSLTFEKAGTIEVEFAVQGMGAGQGQGGHDGH